MCRSRPVRVGRFPIRPFIRRHWLTLLLLTLAALALLWTLSAYLDLRLLFQQLAAYRVQPNLLFVEASG